MGVGRRLIGNEDSVRSSGGIKEQNGEEGYDHSTSYIWMQVEKQKSLFCACSHGEDRKVRASMGNHPIPGISAGGLMCF